MRIIERTRLVRHLLSLCDGRQNYGKIGRPAQLFSQCALVIQEVFVSTEIFNSSSLHHDNREVLQVRIIIEVAMH